MMETRLSTKGQIVLPEAVLRALDLRPGDVFDVGISGNALTLVPRHARRREPRIVVDPLSGRPALSAGDDTTSLTTDEVCAILEAMP